MVTHTKANRWLNLFCTDGMLTLVKEADHKKHEAREFRFVADPSPCHFT